MCQTRSLYVKIAVIWDSLLCALHVFSFAMCFPLLFILSCACCVYIVRPCASVIVSRLHPLLLPALFPPHLFPIIILSVCLICPPGSCLCSSFYLSPVFLLSTVGLFRFCRWEILLQALRSVIFPLKLRVWFLFLLFEINILTILHLGPQLSPYLEKA